MLFPCVNDEGGNGWSRRHVAVEGLSEVKPNAGRGQNAVVGMVGAEVSGKRLLS